ncbi:hypothetical protein BKM31_05000 [[Actinomadura] parvosata subsp. kistnae]|uniref:AAA+ ATPase domain-containing protein n=2 Tax=Nonomuraea TaxID=83681 RepID=A0A1U9ZSL2_9ACTN|nr:hypothetical protein BKM31_05000 [Nonomuraea sp. ATCC 55076]
MHLQWSLKPDPHTAPNALIIGPTGVGKTHAIRTASEILNIPLAIVDATRLTSHGLDSSLDAVLVELISAARRVIAGEHGASSSELDEQNLARRGVVFIDEFDKLATRERSSHERNELIQRRLLQFVDGMTVVLNPSPENGNQEILFDTQGLLFIAAGAFTDLLDDLGQRPLRTMGQMKEHNRVIPLDIERYGFMQELVARLPVLIEFSNLSEDNLVEILLRDVIDPSKFYVQYISSLGSELVFTPESRRWAASSAVSLEIGARGLHQVLFPILAQLSQNIEEEQVPPKVVKLDMNMIMRLKRQIEAKRNAR